jgi:S-methylmethionine-dependent homocysteine/selenocysteine methylase
MASETQQVDLRNRISGLDAIALREEIISKEVTILSGAYWSEVEKISSEYNHSTTGGKRALFTQVGQGHVAHIAHEYEKRLQNRDWFALPTFGLDDFRLRQELSDDLKLDEVLMNLDIEIKGNYDEKLDTLIGRLNSDAFGLAEAVSTDKDVVYVAPIAPVGDCYDGRGFPGQEVVTAANLLLKQVNILKDKADVFLFETNCTIEQGISAAIAGEQSAKSYVISFTVDKDGYLRGTHGGVSVADAIKVIDGYANSGLVTYGLNCCSAEGAEKALKKVDESGLSDKLKLVYLNASTACEHDENDHRYGDGSNLTEWEVAIATQRLQREYDLKILGVCCGGTARYLPALRLAGKKDTEGLVNSYDRLSKIEGFTADNIVLGEKVSYLF